ncbi:hypothetical protein ACJMK2_039758 [Sinanodonta woodiana]|uniref:Amidohydrolase-related domain-containing protein n=1 Tax=Sinanodonta woodiana TaxID=1069815 RepID=A0ABD3WEH7_SINWO
MEASFQEGYVDTHFHIWDLQKFKYPWPTPDMAIYRNYSPEILWSEMQETPLRYGIFVQCLNRSTNEAKWVIEQASKYPFIKGIVAGLDLEDLQIHREIDEIRSLSPLVKGVRHILDEEADDWICRDDVGRGLAVLQEKGLTYDLLVRPHHLKYIPEVIQKYPKLNFVVDHIAKPFIKDKVFDGWKEDMRNIAMFPNVFCKLSGMVTEADWYNWKTEDFKQYVDHIIKIFSPERCMFGSDWPVCSLANSTLKQVFQLMERLLSSCSEQDRQKIFRTNAIKFYNLDL